MLCGYEGVLDDFKGRVGVKCPKCGSLERHRALLDVILQNIGEQDGGKCLHIAPSCRKEFLGLFERMGYDYEAIDRSGKRGDMMSIEDMSERILEDSIDVMLCLHVLEHVDDVDICLREMAWVMSPKGKLILQVPLGGELGADDHKSVFTKASLEKLISRYFRWAITVRRNEVFYLCTKIVFKAPIAL